MGFHHQTETYEKWVDLSMASSVNVMSSPDATTPRTTSNGCRLQKGHQITSLHRGQTMRHDQRGAPWRMFTETISAWWFQHL